MAKRFRMSRSASRADFRNKADRIHVKNNAPVPMRGGIRL